MIRKCIFILTFCLPFMVTGQTYGDQKFYLIDSLNLENIGTSDLELIDSCLTKYHAEENDTSRMNWIAVIVNQAEAIKISESYTLFILHYTKAKKDRPDISAVEQKFYYDVFTSSYGNLGFYAEEQGNLSASLDYYYKALEIDIAVNNQDDLMIIYLNIGGLYHALGDLEKALEYSYKCKTLLDEVGGHEELQVFVLNNLAVLSNEAGDVERSKAYHRESLALCKEQDNKFGAGMSHNNLGGMYSSEDSIALAFEHFKKAERIFLELDDTKWLSHTYQKLGTTYLRQENFTEATNAARLAFEYAQKGHYVGPKMRAAHLLYRVNEKKGNYEKALYYYQKHEHLRDSISGEELRLEVLQKELTFQNETEKALAVKEHEKKLEIARAEKKQQAFITYAILGGLILVIIFSFILLSRLRITTRQKAVIEKQNDERKLLLKEIHHRVKNNFQIVSSVLRLQAAEEDNRVLDQSFDDAINRIHSMAAVHEMIYKQDDFASIIPKDYFIKLTDSMRTYSSHKNIEFDVDSEVGELNIQTLIPLGISLNEMITNSIKYAFQKISTPPKIQIRLEKQGENFVLSYKDNGVGIGNDTKTDSFGMELIKTIIDQIDGQLEQVKDENWNTHLRIRFR